MPNGSQWLALLLGACLWVTAPTSANAQLTLTDVRTIVAQAVTRAVSVAPDSTIAITDREGNVLGVWSLQGAPATDEVANAIAKAGTAAYLSSDQHAFTTRTAGFIVQQNFPPGVQNRPPGPLVGVNFSNLPFSDINKLRGPGSVVAFDATPGNSLVPVPTPVTGGLAGTPGGVPLYKNGQLVGGVGVVGDGDGPTDITPQTIGAPDVDEAVALAAQRGFEPDAVIAGSHVFIDGIRLAYLETPLGAVQPTLPFGSLPGGEVAPHVLTAAPPTFAYPNVVLGGVAGEMRQPVQADPLPGTINGEARLTAAEVTGILTRAAERARTTRAGIRLPRGQSARVWVTVVNNPAADGVAPAVLGTFRVADATMFSWDVAVQKARSCVFFSNDGRAYSTRTVGFLAQSLYPPGIAGTQPGLFLGLQEKFSMFPQNVTNPLNGAVVTTAPAVNPNLPNGITIFPGGFPLYRNGVLIGAIGVSGDGVDQDDIIAASGAEGFLPPNAVRADRTAYRGARLPFAKFPRNPAL